MKLQVKRRDGSLESLNLVGECACKEASLGGQSSITVIETGYTHFFTEDGIYDGWGADISRANLNLDEAFGLIQAIEVDRETQP